MMLNKVMRIYIVFLLLVSGLSNGVYGQRGGGGSLIGKIGSVTLTPTITHATCFNPKSSVDYLITVSSGWNKYTKVNFINLINSVGDVVYDPSNPVAIGSVLNLLAGSYTFTGSITTTSSTGFFISIPFTITIWIGIESSWKEFVDMSPLPNNYSAKRIINNQSYGGALSYNQITTGDFWIEMSAVYGSSSDSYVYWVIGETDDISYFNSSGNDQYIQFYSTSSGSGVLVRYLNQGVFTTTIISTNKDDKIRLIRTGTIIRLQKNNDNTILFSFPNPNNGPFNIGVFTRSINDACINVVSSLTCVYDNQYYYLKENIEQSIAYIPSETVKFKFIEKYYDISGNLQVEILDLSDVNSTPQITSLNKTKGVDFYEIKNGVNGVSIISGKTYLLTVIDSKEKKQYLKFKVA